MEEAKKLIKTVLKIGGMSCGMCESHINDTIRKNFDISKVSSSHKKGETEIISDKPLDEKKIREVMEPTGYKVLSISSEPYEKKGFFGFFK